MLLQDEIDKYLCYCEIQKELDIKTIKAYRTDLKQFTTFMENYDDIGKDEMNSYLMHIHSMYKQKTVKRKIASVKALFRYLEEEEIITMNPFHKMKTKFKEEIVLPKIVPRKTIENLLDYLYTEMNSEGNTKWKQKLILRDIAVVEMLFSTG